MRVLSTDEYIKIPPGTEVTVHKKDDTWITGKVDRTSVYGAHVGGYYVSWQHIETLEAVLPEPDHTDPLVAAIMKAFAEHEDQYFERDNRDPVRLSGAKLRELAEVAGAVASDFQRPPQEVFAEMVGGRGF